MKVVNKIATRQCVNNTSIIEPERKFRTSSHEQFAVFALLLLTLLFSAARAANPDPATPEKNIVILGDSLSAAYGLEVTNGWVAKLQLRLQQEGFQHIVVNASVSGDTTIGGVTRLPLLLRDYKPEIVIVELGGNDGLRGLSIKKMRSNLTDIVAMAANSNAQTLVVGMQIPTNYGAAYTQLFRDTFKQVAEENQSPLVPFLLQGVAGRSEWFQSDGIHPNADAQETMLDNVWEYLAPMLQPRD